MAFTPPSRSSGGSTGSASSAPGTSHHLILEHMLHNNDKYELPFRANYSFPRRKRSAPDMSPTPRSKALTQSPLALFPSPYGSTPIDGLAECSNTATAKFTSLLMSHVIRLPPPSSNVTPINMASFVRRCFPRELELVDFPQSLEALKYLADLENRRKREIADSLVRSGYDDHTSEQAAQKMPLTNPGVAKWASTVFDKERKIEKYYEQVWITLRRWILINEMSLVPFNKHNVLAMINTLLPLDTPPPGTTSQSPLPLKVMTAQREAYLRYAQLVEKKGTRVLEPLMDLGRVTMEPTGWPSISRTLDSYLRHALSLLYECNEIKGPQDFDAHGLKSMRITGLRRRRDTDSGAPTVKIRSIEQSRSVSSPQPPLDTPSRPLAGRISSSSTRYMPIPAAAPVVPIIKRKPMADGTLNPTPPLTPLGGTEKSGVFSAIERIAREVRRIKERRKAEAKVERLKLFADETDPSTGANSLATSPASTFSADSSASVSNPRGLRRLKSLGDMKDGKRRSKSVHDLSLRNNSPDTFDLDSFKRPQDIKHSSTSTQRDFSVPSPPTPSLELFTRPFS